MEPPPKDAPSAAPPKGSARLWTAIDAVSALDPVLAALVARVGRIQHLPRDPDGPFAALVRALVYLEIADAAGLYQLPPDDAAVVLYRRVKDAVGGPLSPESLAGASVADLMATGISAKKAASLRDLADKTLDGTVILKPSAATSDAELIKRLTTVAGLGQWTAKTFLMFELRRPDVWPTTDLAVRRGYAAAWGLDKVPTPSELQRLGERFRPHRSVVARYCWAALELDESSRP